VHTHTQEGAEEGGAGLHARVRTRAVAVVTAEMAEEVWGLRVGRRDEGSGGRDASPWLQTGC
jgi:hypothetical protein